MTPNGTPQHMSLEEYKSLMRNARPQQHHHVESGIQQGCVQWFRAQYPKLRNLLFSVPNESAGHNGRILAEGVVAGVADMIFLYPAHGFHGLCVEFKTSKGRQSEAQREWEQSVTEMGYKYTIIRNFAQFYKLINFWIDK